MDEIIKRLDRIIALLEELKPVEVPAFNLESAGIDPEMYNDFLKRAVARIEEDEQVRANNAAAYQCDQLAAASLYDLSQCCPNCHRGMYAPRTVNTPIGPLQLCCKANAALNMTSSVVTH